MTSSFRIAVLAALTIFIVSSVPTTSVARGFPCENAQDCLGAGAFGVAVISSIMGAPDVAEAAERFLRVIMTADAQIS